MLTFEVPYTVKGAARPRAGKRGSHTVIYMPGEHVAAERSLALTMQGAAEFAAWGRLMRPGVCSVTILIVTARPQAENAKKWPNGRYFVRGKPDADNVAKLVLDAGTQAGLWEDDTQVAELVVRRVRAARGEGPSTRIAIALLSGLPPESCR